MELTKPPVQWVAGEKGPGHKVDPLHQSAAEVRNKWSHTSAALICLLGMERDNVAFLLIFRSRESMEIFICSHVTRLD